MERLLFTNNEITDKKLNKVNEKLITTEMNIRNETNQVKQDINIVKYSNQAEFNKINQTVEPTEDS